MTEIIKPGAYKLVADLTNPEPDRRVTRDWRKFPVWKAGTEFLVIEQDRRDLMDEEYLASLPEESRTRIRNAARYSVIQLVGDQWPTIHQIGPGHVEQYATLGAHLVKVEESLEAFLSRLGAHANHFAGWLLETNKVSRELFESWWNAYQSGEE